MQKIDFLFTRNRCRAEEGNRQDIQLIKTFIKKGYSSGMISSCERIHSRLKKDGIFSVQLFDEIKVPSKLENMEERAGRIEKEYGILSLKRFIFPEKCYYNEDENFLLRKAVVYFEWLEDFFNKIQVGCLVNAQGGQIDIRVMYYIAKKRGIPLIFPGESLFLDRIFLFSDEMKNSFGYNDVSWEEMTEEERKEIEEHMDRFRNRKDVYNHSLMRNKGDEIFRSFIAFQEYMKNKKFETFRIMLFKKIEELISKNFNKFFSKFIYQNNLKDEKFIFFPLHISNDSQITIRNPQFYDQSTLALYIARSLPFGYKLYIKEHPGYLFSIKEKMNLLKEKNVVLLSPKINAHKIVQKAKAIVVINSTVGFEALYYFKPVVVLGNWHLKKDGVTINVKDIFKLDEAIKTALETEVDEKKIKSFLFSLKKSTYGGSIMTPKMDYDEMMDSIAKKYEELSIEK